MWIVYLENVDVGFVLVEDYVFEFFLEVFLVFGFKVNWDNVLIFFGWVFCVSDCFVWVLDELFWVFFDIGMVGGVLKCKIKCYFDVYILGFFN